MTSKDIDELFRRLGRLVNSSQVKAGNGTEWDYTFPNGETYRYIINNIRAHNEVEDAVGNLLIWIWNAKDYLKLRTEAKGQPRRLIEEFINSDPSLPICGDLAIRLKHGDTSKSRSGKFPRLGSVSFSAPQFAIKSLTFRAFEVAVDIGDPEGVDFRIPVLDEAGNELVDVFQVMASAIEVLEKLRYEIEECQGKTCRRGWGRTKSTT